KLLLAGIERLELGAELGQVTLRLLHAVERLPRQPGIAVERRIAYSGADSLGAVSAIGLRFPRDRLANGRQVLIGILSAGDVAVFFFGDRHLFESQYVLLSLGDSGRQQLSGLVGVVVQHVV